ncbi:MAG: hypothetical protein C4K49_12440 [Candidatus Thorarchaeota archaeon]|nr:MAG: hypothetical protein C4K49_12440 [Candidatus Thorarchaeota archaeon]
MTITVDDNLLKTFEEQLDPSRPEESPMPAKVLGYGEISTVFEILQEDQSEIAFKRMPLFDTVAQVESYESLYERYNEQLVKIGLQLPEYGATHIVTDSGRIVLYLYQEKQIADAIGNKVIHKVSNDECFLLVRHVFRELNKVWKFNNKHRNKLELAIDGQVSNWSVQEMNPNNPSIGRDTRLEYLDTSTPLMRENGKELLDAVLFLKPTPLVMRWVLKRFYLQDILDRYYDLRRVCLDLVANFLKEQRSDLVPGLIDVTNEFFRNEAVIEHLAPLTPGEVKSYYDNDASTWRLYLRLRRMHRFMSRKVLRRYYPYILPGRIVR